ncbi:MAG TPA: isoprenyl transferase [Thermomicrobiales bacterium]|nr:isoprenyl transferase [Thermomicrobiales bacterium]
MPIDPTRIPRHVAIIMDGNGRWARQRGLARIEGHEAGTENIRRITHAAGQLGIRYLTLWAFSAENWRRPREEVEGILNILGRAIETETEELHRQGAQLRHIGDLGSLSSDLQRAIEGAIERTKHNDKLVLTLAFNYGGRQELLRAVQDIVASGVSPEHIDESTVERHLYTHDLPDPDLIIRTSGEYRLSNFLCWQGAYSELHFSPTLWPDFSPSDLETAVRDFAQRERRFGAISSSSTTG